MLRSSTHDQLSNVIYKIQNRYQHHHYYYNDLNYRCDRKTKETKRYKRRKRNRRSKKKPKATKYLNKINHNSTKYCNSCNSKNINISNSSSSSITTINNANECYVPNCTECVKVNIKISYQINSYLKHIYNYFEKNFNHIHLVLAIILLALIACTAQSLDNQVKFKQMLTNSPKLLAELNDTVSTATKNLKESLHTTACRHQHKRNADLSAKPDANTNYETHICHNLRHRYRRYRKGQSHPQLVTATYNMFENLKFYNKSSPQKLTNNNMLKKFETNLYNQQNATHNHYQHANDDDYDHHISDSAIVNKRIEQSYNNKKNYMEIADNITKEDERQREINNRNISKFFQHIRENKSHNTSNSYKTNYIHNKRTSKTKNVNSGTVIINHIDKYETDDQHNDHAVHDGDNTEHFETSYNLLPTVNHSLQFINNQKGIDHIALMKLVMDGLGLKKIPKMGTINISQEEYVTKYREYLQRVHTRKRPDLQDVNGEYDLVYSKPLDIFTIVSNSLLLSHYEEYHKSYNERARLRQRRNVLDLNNDSNENSYQDRGSGEDRNRSLEERVRNILLLKKKYQKPRSTKEQRDERKTNIRLMFALKPEIFNLSSSDIEEANIRLVLIHSPILAIRNSKNRKIHKNPKNNSCRSNKNYTQKNLYQLNVLNLKLFFISKHGKRILLDGRNLDVHVDHTKPDETYTQWLQFDVSKAVKMSVDDKKLNHIVLELQCDNCKRIGARILNDAYSTAAEALADVPLTEGHQHMPVLNIIGRFGESHRSIRPHRNDSHLSDVNKDAKTQRHYHHKTYNNKSNNNRRTNCYKANQRCCRHSMEVTFKEIKGFEFIIQPKVFDAGYCHGRCPPRYNPAHHHALLQSLIWKQNHHKAPRPCCAPSKLVELEVLHVDEKNNNKLKISTWSDMKVVECACS